MNTHFFRLCQTAAVLAAVSVAAAALADAPIADEKIAVAQASVARAEQSGAPVAAPVELANAREKLARAQKANSDHDRKQATAWAEQADLDAQVAEAMAQLQRSQKAANQFDINMQALRQESMRSTAPAQ